MKSRIATYLIAMSMFIAGTAFASNPVKQNNDASETISSILKQELKYPKIAKEHDNLGCCVLIRLVISEDGSFEVDCVNCSDESIKAHIIEAIEKISKEELKEYAGQQFSYKISFKLI